MCYSDLSWPIVANTMITKAVNSSLEHEILNNCESGWIDTSADWVKREKYFLVLRDHEFRSKWKSSNNCFNLSVDDLLDYKKFVTQLTNFGIKVDNFKKTWEKWYLLNKPYVDPCLTATQVLSAVEQNKNLDLGSMTDIWSQAVLYYYIWLKYNIEVPHNQFENFFKNTNKISEWLKTN
jgi:hypothetical protein